jgi:hypothetical protein
LILQRESVYLHQCLRIIPSPLVEVPPLFKLLQPWEWGVQVRFFNVVSNCCGKNIQTDKPAIDLVEDLLHASSTVIMFGVVRHPSDQVDFVDPLYRLVKQVGCNQFVYIGSGEMRCVWLAAVSIDVYAIQR